MFRGRLVSEPSEEIVVGGGGKVEGQFIGEYVGG